MTLEDGVHKASAGCELAGERWAPAGALGVGEQSRGQHGRCAWQGQLGATPLRAYAALQVGSAAGCMRVGLCAAA